MNVSRISACVLASFVLLGFFCGCDKETKYGNDSICKDVDGNLYQTVIIGDQEWMAENLKVSHFRNGDSIPFIVVQDEWGALDDDGCCNYNFNRTYDMVYGKLYNYYAATDERDLCPKGWHVPSIDEWDEMIDYLGGASVAGAKLKDSSLEFWANPNTSGTNETGFNALPGGLCSSSGSFYNLGNDAQWWSFTEENEANAWMYWVSCQGTSVSTYAHGKTTGLAIRCVKD